MWQDRYDRRALLLIWGVTGAVLFTVFAALGQADWPTTSVLLEFSVVIGLRQCMLGNTSNTMLRGIVPDDQLPKALSLNNGLDVLVNLIGDPVGGLMALLVSRHSEGCLNAAATLCSMWAGGLCHVRRFGRCCDDTVRIHSASALLMTCMLAVGTVVALSMKALVTMPKPQGWKQHVATYHLHRL